MTGPAALAATSSWRRLVLTRTVNLNLSLMRNLAALLLALSLGACGGDSPAEPSTPESVIGTYVLQSMDGRSLPATLSDELGRSLTIAAGVFTFEPFVNCESVLLIEDHRRDGVYSEEDEASCYYEQDGSAVALDFKTSFSILQALIGDETTASLDGRALTIAGGGHTLVYRRQ